MKWLRVGSATRHPFLARDLAINKGVHPTLRQDRRRVSTRRRTGLLADAQDKPTAMRLYDQLAEDSGFVVHRKVL
jgi:hypothetical protein